MSIPSDDLDRKITTGNVAIIAIPSFLTLLVLILLGYLTFIVSAFNHSQSLSACRGKVSQEIQERFRTDVSDLIAIAGEADDGPDHNTRQNVVLIRMGNRPSYVAEVKKQCGQDLGKPTESFAPKVNPTSAPTSTTTEPKVPEE